VSSSPSISELVARVRATYADCAAYQDTGAVTTVFIRDRPKQLQNTVKKPFRTAFMRPDRFFYEFTEASERRNAAEQRMTVLWNEHGVRSSWTVRPGVEAHASIGAPLAAATGVSGGSARNVVGLLLPGCETGDPLANAEDGEWLRTVAEEGDVCHVFRYAPVAGLAPHTVWIDARDFVIRRVDSTHVFDAEWFEAQRARHEQLLKGNLAKAHREMLEHMLAQRPYSQRPFRTETTLRCTPSFALPDASMFATPQEWSAELERGSA
jgi:hypothetical protein